MDRRRRLTFESLILVALLTAARNTPKTPVAPAELGDGPIDEVAQLEKMRVALRRHYRADNEDTRFIVDRNDKGIFRIMRNVGLVHFRSDDDPNETKIGTGTLLNECFVLTAYHVVEGPALIDANKMPVKDRPVKFSYGPKMGQIDGFEVSLTSGTVFDPGILDLNNRRWSDDIALVRLNQKQVSVTPLEFGLGHIFDKKLPTDSWLANNSLFVTSGYPADKIKLSGKLELEGDFCNVLGAASRIGASTSCVLTGGMSGGPLFLGSFTARNRASFQLVGMSTQASAGTGLFAKQSHGRSLIVPLTPAKIAKIKVIIDRPTDDQCQPTDGKPW